MASIDSLRSGQLLSNLRNSSSTNNTQGRTEAREESGHTPRDAVSLSSQARAVGQIHQQLAAEPSFDRNKVESIKNAISNGSYQVDADRLASNMLRFEDELRGL
ncbi:flagellar biosynthesis anti-sigma factor FlgM [Photobacterium sp. WH77]|uniref:Negative regulator of flagellin synthesis n=1 Tax=Photobacterium arenosum TaxID=2774143 RepID=A0ABR9BGZ3_9GAMM|nr:MULTISPECIES: flagellar biosynthesis anti-sigma factor FlgM [Photobacterium]MBD8511830.1 flagellar biosynthesis anti-sigma factor FlgM [Photobacterium arenosum]MBV7261466.1 flagellar biosynthesis anti-sigma factor FlgM [Photobacterium sp. WH24]MCG2836905.1 flagellar biosynthesis anti-sigma factor FlgM [Photobacterium sp. WH77]MCG2844486.1 flagellar biosynthesis anti-sigma factor FlgM [Photobacterium sp. WH80]MDO6581695.1 flagellar biosynthesis anti-sigma factor FlgM [Photobacterium sp. 2_MG